MIAKTYYRVNGIFNRRFRSCLFVSDGFTDNDTSRFLALHLIFLALLVLPAAAPAQTTLFSGATIPITISEGQSFSQTFVGTGSLDNSYTLNGVPPDGLSIATIAAPPSSTSNHQMVISGIPTSPGVYTFNIDVSASSFSAVISYTTTLVITVTAAPTRNAASGAANQHCRFFGHCQ